jgi:hypothetical protein
MRALAFARSLGARRAGDFARPSSSRACPVHFRKDALRGPGVTETARDGPYGLPISQTAPARTLSVAGLVTTWLSYDWWPVGGNSGVE